jgi:hypothetical protein
LSGKGIVLAKVDWRDKESEYIFDGVWDKLPSGGVELARPGGVDIIPRMNWTVGHPVPLYNHWERVVGGR